MEGLIKLNKPIVEALTMFEADSPLLSQVLPTWKKLLKHVKDLHEKKELPFSATTMRDVQC